MLPLENGRVCIVSKKNNANEVCKQVTLKLFNLLIQIILPYESTLVLFITDTNAYRKVLTYRQPLSSCYPSIICLLEEVPVPCVEAAEN